MIFPGGSYPCCPCPLTRIWKRTWTSPWDLGSFSPVPLWSNLPPKQAVAETLMPTWTFLFRNLTWCLDLRLELIIFYYEKLILLPWGIILILFILFTHCNLFKVIYSIVSFINIIGEYEKLSWLIALARSGTETGTLQLDEKQFLKFSFWCGIEFF